jgi:hypothetical protein
VVPIVIYHDQLGSIHCKYQIPCVLYPLTLLSSTPQPHLEIKSRQKRVHPGRLIHSSLCLSHSFIIPQRLQKKHFPATPFAGFLLVWKTILECKKSSKPNNHAHLRVTKNDLEKNTWRKKIYEKHICEKQKNLSALV